MLFRVEVLSPGRSKASIVPQSQQSPRGLGSYKKHEPPVIEKLRLSDNTFFVKNMQIIDTDPGLGKYESFHGNLGPVSVICRARTHPHSQDN